MSKFTRERLKRLRKEGVDIPRKVERYPSYRRRNAPKNLELWYSGPEEFSNSTPVVNEESEFEKWKKEHQYPNFVPKDWTECYKMPLHLDSPCCFAWTADYSMALSNFRMNEDDEGQYKKDKEFFEEVISIINKDKESEFTPEWSQSPDDVCVITYKGEYQFLVRGWGHLTGCGHALNLPTELAEKIQDEFIKYILDRLNGVK